VLADDLLDDLVYAGSVSLSHSGGLEHTLEAHAMRSTLGQRAECLDIVTDQGGRPDHILAALMCGWARGQRRSNAGMLARLARMSCMGYYSSIYYVIGDRFAREL